MHSKKSKVRNLVQGGEASADSAEPADNEEHQYPEVDEVAMEGQAQLPQGHADISWSRSETKEDSEESRRADDSPGQLMVKAMEASPSVSIVVAESPAVGVVVTDSSCVGKPAPDAGAPLDESCANPEATGIPQLMSV